MPCDVTRQAKSAALHASFVRQFAQHRLDMYLIITLPHIFLIYGYLMPNTDKMIFSVAILLNINFRV